MKETRLINTSFKYLVEKNPTASIWFRTLHVITILTVSTTIISLMALGVMKGTDAYKGNINLEIAMTSLQTIEPILMISAMLMMFKGKRNFFWLYIAAQAVIVTTSITQSMWMGVVRTGITVVATTFTYIKWGKGNDGELVVKKADGKVWVMIAASLTILILTPGLILQFIPESSIFKPQNSIVGWFDTMTFAGSITSLVLTAYKYREARLISFVIAFVWPPMFFGTGVWMFGTNSIFFWFVSLVGLAQWWYRSHFSSEEQKMMK